MSICRLPRTRSIILLIITLAIMENMILLVRIEKQRYVQYNLPNWISHNITKDVLPTIHYLKVNEVKHAQKNELRRYPDVNSDKYAQNIQQKVPKNELQKSEKSPNSTKTPKRKANLVISEEQYYKRKAIKVNPFRSKFLLVNSGICRPSTELVIIVHSLHKYQDRRSAIRQTWGSAARTSYNPTGYSNISLAFSFGLHKERRWNEVLKNESDKYGDIIQGDFREAYNNMTYKSLLEIKWVLEYCPTAKFLLKSDDDMFLNLPYLMEILSSHSMTRSIMGPYNLGSRVYRTGKWAIPQNVYPFKTWPEYESGSAYVISSDLLKDIFETAEFVPPIHIDDVYITGIIGKIIGAKHVRVSGFAFWNSRPPIPCDIVSNKLVTGTKMTPKNLLSLWAQIIRMSISSRAQCNKTVTSAPPKHNTRKRKP